MIKNKKSPKYQKISGFKYSKVSGSGNTFLIFDLSSEVKKKVFKKIFLNKSRSKIAEECCEKKNTDGMIFLLQPSLSSSFSFLWDFFNKDGSKANMCGNGARAVAYYAYRKKKVKKKTFSFKLISGKKTTAYIFPNHQVEVEFSPVKLKEWNQKTTMNGKEIKFHHIDSGVPHTVIECLKPWKRENLKKFSLDLRKNKKFSPQKTNITYFYPLRKKNHIRAISFERGVESFTQACGTGAIAAAFSFHKKYNSKPKILITMPGGILEIDLSSKHPRLKGQVKIIEEGYIRCTL